MPNSHLSEKEFIDKLTHIVEENLSKEKFGVSELAKELGMSRSSLHRKLNPITKTTVSQFINQIRLKHAQKMLQKTTHTVSEVAYNVGFNSPSYFIKCFRDYYGYSPSKVGDREKDESIAVQANKKRLSIILASVFFSFVLAIISLVIFKPFSDKQNELEKTIALLPPRYDSSDSDNIHTINGVWSAVIDNLSIIGDFERVMQRQSVEKYRNTTMSLEEIADELDVDYVCTSNGQVIGNKIQYTIRLIEAIANNQIWHETYNKSISDMEILNQDIAKEIADEIKVIITPEEKERINTVSTKDSIAHDYFLKGSDILNQEDSYENWYSKKHENLEQAVVYFKKALEQDKRYAMAYAELSYTLYLMDNARPEKKYSYEIEKYAGLAMLYNSKLDKSLIAKAISYFNKEEYELAIPYLKEALRYNPHSFKAIWFLDYINWFFLTDVEQQLEYVLRTIKMNISSVENHVKSDEYNRLARAFRWAGFFKDAEYYVEKSLQLNPENLLAIDEKGQLLVENGDYQKTKELLIEALKKDSLQIDIIRSLATTNYFMGNYPDAVKYWRKLFKISESLNSNQYNLDNLRMATALLKTGKEKESEEYYKKHVEIVAGYYEINMKHRLLAGIYSFTNENNKAIDELKILSQLDNYPYWLIRILKNDPVYDNISHLPEFQQILSDMENKFWANHERIKANLTEKRLL